MTNQNESPQKLKVISLPSKVAFVERKEGKSESDDDIEDVIIAPLFIDEDEAIANLGELVETVYEEFSAVCEKNKLNWSAELEVGLKLGVQFTAKLSISPKNEV